MSTDLVSTGERRKGASYGKNRTSHRSWRATRTWARRTMDPTCHLCGRPIDLTISNYRLPEAWSLDHIVPVAMGGSNQVENLAPAHRGCNSAKGDGTTPASQARFGGRSHRPDQHSGHTGQRDFRAKQVNGQRWYLERFPTTNPSSPHFIPMADRYGPDASDNRAHVYQGKPDVPVTARVHFDHRGEAHTCNWGDGFEMTWRGSDPWPPRLPADPYRTMRQL